MSFLTNQTPTNGALSIQNLSPGSQALAVSCGIGSPLLSSATSIFVSGDIGKLATLAAPTNSSQVFTGQIVAVSADGKTATLNGNSAIAIAAGQLAFGFDNYQQFTDAFASAQLKKVVDVLMPNGFFLVSKGIVIPDGINLKGADWSGAIVGQLMNSGSVIIPASKTAGNFGVYSTNFAVQVGVSIVKSGDLRAMLSNVAVDAFGLSAFAVYQRGIAAEVNYCAIRRGSVGALFMSNPIGRVVGNDIAQLNSGSPLIVSDAQDILIQGNYIHGAGGTVGNPAANILVQNFSADLQILGNHLWCESPLSALAPANNIQINAVGSSILGLTVVGNVLDTVYGHSITINSTAAGVCVGWTITGNWFLNNDAAFPNNVFDVLNISSAAGCISSLITFSNNFGQNVLPGATNSWARLIGVSGAGLLAGITCNGNVFGQCNSISGGVKLDGNVTSNTLLTSASAIVYSNARGRSTQTGTGVATVFNIAHGLSETPQTWNVQPRVALAAPNFIVTADAVNLIVTYAVAPPAVANNVDLTWNAAL